MKDCLFCRIIRGEIPSTKVFENEYVYAFRDINPVAPVHVLVVPKKHIDNVMDISEDDQIYLTEIFKAIQQIAVNENVSDDGFRIISNCGENGCQTVYHLHFHLIGGRRLSERLM